MTCQNYSVYTQASTISSAPYKVGTLKPLSYGMNSSLLRYARQFVTEFLRSTYRPLIQVHLHDIYRRNTMQLQWLTIPQQHHQASGPQSQTQAISRYSISTLRPPKLCKTGYATLPALSQIYTKHTPTAPCISTNFIAHNTTIYRLTHRHHNTSISDLSSFRCKLMDPTKYQFRHWISRPYRCKIHMKAMYSRVHRAGIIPV